MRGRYFTVSRSPGQALGDLSLLEKMLLTAEIIVAYIEVRWLMRRRDIRAAVQAVRGRARGQVAATDDALLFAGRLGSIVDARLRMLPGDTRCLARSLVLLRLLARRGLTGVLVIGVRTQPAFGAHAWVEVERRSLLQPIERTGHRLAEL